MIKPKEHQLYWIYAWDVNETEYDFDTTTQLVLARRVARMMIKEGWDHAYIWFGDEDGAFTWIDPADSVGR